MNTVVQTKLPNDLAEPLQLDVAISKGQLVTTSEPQALPKEDPLSAKAKEMVHKIIAVTPEQYEETRRAIDSAGSKVVAAAHHKSELLRGKLGDFKAKSEDGGPVANALIDLRDKVADLDPSGIDFTVGWWARLLGMIPFIGNPVKRYFNRFETGQGAIDSIVKSLENGKNTLENDNRILATDQKVWRENTILIREQISYLMTVDRELEQSIPSIVDPDHRRFIEEEVLFPLRQRIQDLMQRLAVNQQGVIVSEVLIRNNRELVRGVDRALFVTVDALNIAVAAAMALANQKLVLDSVQALNSTTNTLIAGTAARLRTQGVDIQKQASSTMLASDTLKRAFSDLGMALDDISKYRREALPKMAETILSLDSETKKAEEAIRRMESGNAVQVNAGLVLDLPVAA